MTVSPAEDKASKSASAIEKALQIALEAHSGQTDKGGAAYILHPLRLMSQLTDEAEMMAALLHDVVEDSDFTLNDLYDEGVPLEVLEVVNLLTKRQGDDYDTFIKRLAKHPIARRIKLLDIRDNMDITRLSTITEVDIFRLQKYIDATRYLEDMTKQENQPTKSKDLAIIALALERANQLDVDEPPLTSPHQNI